MFFVTLTNLKIMKTSLKLLLIYNVSFAICWLSGAEASAQNIGINGTGANAHASALLDIDDSGTNNKGLLIPRIPLTAINVATPVISPATSLLVYNTASASTGTNAVTPGYYYWDGTKWVRFAYSASGSSANDWNLLGNASTNPTTNFLGTTDAQDLVFRTSNVENMRIVNSNGSVGIGINNPQGQLHVFSTSILTAAPILKLERTGSLGFTHFHSGATIGDWNELVNNGDKSIIFSNDGNPNADASTGLLIGPWTGSVNPTGGQKGLKIMENGNVGIGTNSPGSLLTLKKQYSTYTPPDYLFTMQSGNGTTGDILRTYYQYDAAVMEIGYYGFAAGKVVIDGGTSNSGMGVRLYNGASVLKTNICSDPLAYTYFNANNVGIGTATPAAKLEVQDNANRRTLHVEHNFNGLVNTDAAFIGGIDAGYSNTGLFVLQKDNVSFVSAGSNLINVVSNSVSQMVINGLGNMGIGTASPALKLHLHDGGQNFHALRFTSGVSQANYWDLVKRGDAYGGGQNHNFVIAFNLVERLNITPTGEFGIGTANPSSRLDVFGAKPTAGAGTGISSNAATQAIIADGSGGASYQNDWPAGWGGGLATWDICGQGTFFTLYNTRSDRRLKKDITDMNQTIETNFMKLRPVTYLFKKETPEVNGTQYGFIAQEVAELFPTLVTKDTNVEGATIGMNYQGLIAPTVHVVQEQQKTIEQQQLQISELIKRIEALEKR